MTLTAEGETLVQFRATDGAGNTSGWSAAAPGGAGSVRIDRAPPGAPLMIATPDTTVAANSGRGAVSIATAPAPGDTKSVRVVITQNGRLVHDGAFGTVRDEGLADSTSYRYEAVAYDRIGNVSPVNETLVTTPDRTPPAQPVALDATGSPPRLVVARGPRVELLPRHARRRVRGQRDRRGVHGPGGPRRDAAGRARAAWPRRPPPAACCCAGCRWPTGAPCTATRWSPPTTRATPPPPRRCPSSRRPTA